jgi:hypothetical protein
VLVCCSDGAAALRAQNYIPDGPNVPVVAVSEDHSGAADLPPLPVPPPQGRDQESIWNVKVVGFQDLGEVDDRGYIYNLDRAGSGLTILQLTTDALQVATGQGH